MRRRLLRLVRPLAVVSTLAAAPAFFLAACGTKASLVASGGECFLATDCQPGLVCVEQENKTRVCSDDLSRVAGRPPPEGGAPDTGAREGGADARADAPPRDANVPETEPTPDASTD